MSKISEIHINGFKFFPIGSEPIKVDGKNLLVYGENGSGKSSIFWAVYTLLECANKPDDQIKKYFDNTHPDSLLNIFYSNSLQNPSPSQSSNDAFVRVKLQDNSEYKISYDDLSINTSDEAKEINFASDFINYKLLHKAHDFMHSKEINLFPMFEKFVFPYLQGDTFQIWRFDNAQNSFQNYDTKSINEVWKTLKVGPPKNKQTTSGKARFPLKKESFHEEYALLYDKFISYLEQLFTTINTQGNKILNEKFNVNLNYKLSLNVVNIYKITPQNFIPPELNFDFVINTYNGIADPKIKPHSFLNEAKLTAISLSIRLAILDRRIQTSKLKVLFLDDFLIGLDMSNREVVINLLFNEYINNYQLFIFTHDKQFFEFLKYKINVELDLLQTWKYYEMYESNDNDFQEPFITESLSNLEKAAKYIKIYHDYETAGNHLRKALEKYCIEILPAHLSHNVDYELYDLDNLIKCLIDYSKEHGFYNNNFDSLDRFRKFILNKFSHYNGDYNTYISEINDALETVINLPKIVIRKILDRNKRLYCELVHKDGSNWKAEIVLLEDVFLIRNPINGDVLSKAKMFIKLYKDCVINMDNIINNKLSVLYASWYSDSNKEKTDNYLENIYCRNNNKALIELISN